MSLAIKSIGVNPYSLTEKNNKNISFGKLPLIKITTGEAVIMGAGFMEILPSILKAFGLDFAKNASATIASLGILTMLVGAVSFLRHNIKTKHN